MDDKQVTGIVRLSAAIFLVSLTMLSCAFVAALDDFSRPGYMHNIVYVTPDELGMLDRCIQNDTTRNNEYVLGVYDCIEYTHDTVQNLTCAGYDSGAVYLYSTDPNIDYSHLIVYVNMSGGMVFVSAIQGDIFAPDDLDARYGGEYTFGYTMTLDELICQHDRWRNPV